MKLQLLQMIQIFIECRIIVGGASVWVCGFVWCGMCGFVWWVRVVCVCVVCCVFVEMVVRVC